tara:strand:- start:3606 stop:4043 length:438 start_codon:yes stop_codon:yes gene_type:complete
MAKNELGNLDHHQFITKLDKNEKDIFFYITKEVKNIMDNHNIKNPENIFTLQLTNYNYIFFVNIDNHILFFYYFKDTIKDYFFIPNLKNFFIQKNLELVIINFNKTEIKILKNEIVHNDQLKKLIKFVTPVLVKNNQDINKTMQF